MSAAGAASDLEARYWRWLEATSVPRTGRNAGLLVLLILGVAWIGDLSAVPPEYRGWAHAARGTGVAWTALHTALAHYWPDVYRVHYRWVLVAFMWIVGWMCAAIGTWADALQDVYMLGVVQAQFGYATFIPLRRRDMAIGTLGASLLFLFTPALLGHALTVAQLTTLVSVLVIFALLALYAHHQLLSARVSEHHRAHELQAAREGLEDEVYVRTRQLTDAVARLEESEGRARELARRVVSAREAEGSRISRELHDELGQLLTGLRIGVNVLGRRLRRESQLDAAQDAERLAAIADEAVQSVRAVTRELRPTMLDDLGIVAALDALVGGFRNRTGLVCQLDADIDERRLDAEQRTAVYRVAQEALTNVARHAQASRVTVRLHQAPDAVALCVEDDGVGVDTTRLRQTDGMGLRGMHERALSFGGTIQVVSLTPGTRVLLTLPTGVES